MLAECAEGLIVGAFDVGQPTRVLPARGLRCRHRSFASVLLFEDRNLGVRQELFRCLLLGALQRREHVSDTPDTLEIGIAPGGARQGPVSS